MHSEASIFTVAIHEAKGEPLCAACAAYIGRVEGERLVRSVPPVPVVLPPVVGDIRESIAEAKSKPLVRKATRRKAVTAIKAPTPTSTHPQIARNVLRAQGASQQGNQPNTHEGEDMNTEIERGDA